MAKRLSACWLRRLQHQTRRPFSTTLRPQTDGVFRALTENRIQTPWIDALRAKEREGHDPSKPSGKPETPKDRDLSPKRMSDSYHSVVLPLAREPWLLDTYANSSGHIRLGTLFMDLDALSTSFAGIHLLDPRLIHQQVVSLHTSIPAMESPQSRPPVIASTSSIP